LLPQLLPRLLPLPLLLQIIIFCCAHADQIQEHLKDSKWLRQRAPRVTMVTSTNCFSLGEAMRNLDQRDIIKGTFILVTGVQQSEARYV
jgi:translation initiation factor eIF-2B subunit epsilon